jgi:transcriptional regulator NrdR family protein
MNCPECGGRSKVINTKNSEDKSFAIPKKFSNLPRPFVVRYHKCHDCGKNHKSFEFQQKTIDAMRAEILREIKLKLINLIDA